MANNEMESKLYSGLTAAVKIEKDKKATDVNFIKGFELEIKNEVIETTVLGSQWKNKYPGQATWSGTCDGYANLTEESNQKSLFENLSNGAEVTICFLLNKKECLKGSAIVSNVKVTMSTDDLATISFSFEGNGELTKEKAPDPAEDENENQN